MTEDLTLSCFFSTRTMLHYSEKNAIMVIQRRGKYKSSEVNGGADYMAEICKECSSPLVNGFCTACGYDNGKEIGLNALSSGNILVDRYVLGRVIGAGGFGITYLAYDTECGKRVAVKEYYPKGIAIRGLDNETIEPIASFHAEEFRLCSERFKNEAEILSDLADNIEDIIKVYDIFAQNGTFYYAMELVDGITLEEYTVKFGKISERQALYMAYSIAMVFEHIHNRNVIHRDLAPNNIMVTANGRIKLVDFGNARPFFYNGKNSMTVALKPGFAPLEQYQHHGNHGPWTDFYSLGMVLYYALTLSTPDDPMTRLDDDSEFQNNILQLEPRLAAVIERMSAIRVEERYSHSGELLSDLKLIGTMPERFEL